MGRALTVIGRKGVRLQGANARMHAFRMNRLLLAAVANFLLLPGMVAIVVPLWLARENGGPFRIAGVVPVATGLVLLLWCVRDFYVAGKGTLAPWAPPRRLVTIGLYRYSRNPMYIAVILMLCGWAIGFQSVRHWIYAGGVAAAFHLRVVFGEEPWLARTQGDEWARYKAQVPRWF